MESYNTCFVVSLASFTQHYVFEIHPPSRVYHQIFLLLCRILLYEYETIGVFFQFGPITNKSARDISTQIFFCMYFYFSWVDTQEWVWFYQKPPNHFPKWFSNSAHSSATQESLTCCIASSVLGLCVFNCWYSSMFDLIFQKRHAEMTWSGIHVFFLSRGSQYCVSCHSVHSNSYILLSFIAVC